ncbi:pentatricopeptide repeat-containing protein [Hordeum vulgare]|nr:pentatricopeptide repeat-containing protein [Hordeum vulgare]
MAESSTEIKTLLESLLKRVGSGQLTADKHVEAQLAFNEQVSNDLVHLCKQVDFTHTDVDEVCRHRDQSRSTAPLSPHH